MSQSFVDKTFVEQEITQVQRQVSLPCPFQIQMRQIGADDRLYFNLLKAKGESD